MFRSSILLATITILGIGASTGPLKGQGSGSRGGTLPGAESGEPALVHEAVENYIAVTGSAEIRVAPTRIRVVLGVTSQAPSASGCLEANAEKVDRFRRSLAAIGLPPERFTMDFISILPVYKWQVDETTDVKLMVESLESFQIQDNAHVEVDGEAQARAVVHEAMKVGITDIIAFDYWAADLERHRAAALEKAIQEAKRKADLLLGALFEKRPQPLNVHERTRTLFPQTLYDSFENVHSRRVTPAFRDRNMPLVEALRPKNTYYRGFFGDVDRPEPRPPSGPEISVISTVTLYFAAPGATGREKVFVLREAGSKSL